MYIGEIIKKYREENELSQRAFASKTSLSPSYINTLEKIHNPKTGKPYSVTTDVAVELANAMHIKIENLLNMLSNDQEFILNKVESNVFPTTDIPKKVPVVGKISAGLPILATENIEGYEFAPSSQIKEGFTYFYLRVQGDSMNLKFNEGDIVLIQRQDALENDEIGAILVDGNDATVKKYKFENGLVILEPMSTNPENTVQIYNPKKINIQIIGKVISYQGKI